MGGWGAGGGMQAKSNISTRESLSHQGLLPKNTSSHRHQQRLILLFHDQLCAIKIKRNYSVQNHCHQLL